MCVHLCEYCDLLGKWTFNVISKNVLIKRESTILVSHNWWELTFTELEALTTAVKCSLCLLRESCICIFEI